MSHSGHRSGDAGISSWSNHPTGDGSLMAKPVMPCSAKRPEQRDRLAGDDAIAYDLLNTRTLNGHPSTSNDIRELRESSTGGRGSWSTTKVNRLLKKLERKGLAMQDGHQAQPGDMGGRPALLWWTFEREVIQPPISPLKRTVLPIKGVKHQIHHF